MRGECWEADEAKKYVQNSFFSHHSACLEKIMRSVKFCYASVSVIGVTRLGGFSGQFNRIEVDLSRQKLFPTIFAHLWVISIHSFSLNNCFYGYEFRNAPCNLKSWNWLRHDSLGKFAFFWRLVCLLLFLRAPWIRQREHSYGRSFRGVWKTSRRRSLACGLFADQFAENICSFKSAEFIGAREESNESQRQAF